MLVQGYHPGIRSTHWELVAKCLVLLPIALRDRDSAIVILMVEHVVRNVFDVAQTAATVEVFLEVGLDTGPNFDASPIRGVGHGYVVNVQVLDNVGHVCVLAEGTD